MRSRPSLPSSRSSRRARASWRALSRPRQSKVPRTIEGPWLGHSKSLGQSKARTTKVPRTIESPDNRKSLGQPKVPRTTESPSDNRKSLGQPKVPGTTESPWDNRKSLGQPKVPLGRRPSGDNRKSLSDVVPRPDSPSDVVPSPTAPEGSWSSRHGNSPPASPVYLVENATGTGHALGGWRTCSRSVEATCQGRLRATVLSLRDTVRAALGREHT